MSLPFTDAGVVDRIAFSSLIREKPLRDSYDQVLLGAGCAGLSLGWQLCEAGLTDSLALVDRRLFYDNDRTWCFWDVDSTPFNHLATHRWSRWQVIDEKGEVADCSSSHYRYLRIRSIDFYRFVLARLASDPRVDFYPGSTCQSMIDGDDRIAVNCNAGSVKGRLLFHSVRLPGAHHTGIPPGQSPLVQRFLGQTVLAPGSRFDPDCPILMDFRVGQQRGPHFMYLLPLAPDLALVESTYFRADPLPADLYRVDVKTYLENYFGVNHYEVVEEEAGVIPMSTSISSSKSSARVIPIGLAGGAARPSSGYAFARIQRQVQGMANALAAGDLSRHLQHHRLAPGKYDFLDRVFLRFLADRPSDAPATFSRLFRHVPADSLVRFLCDQSRLADDLSVILALPKRSLITAALRSAVSPE